MQDLLNTYRKIESNWKPLSYKNDKVADRKFQFNILYSAMSLKNFIMFMAFVNQDKISPDGEHHAMKSILKEAQTALSDLDRLDPDNFTLPQLEFANLLLIIREQIKTFINDFKLSDLSYIDDSYLETNFLKLSQ